MKHPLRLSLFLLAWFAVAFPSSYAEIQKDMPQEEGNPFVSPSRTSGLVRIGATEDYPPFSWKNFNRQPTGFLVDLARAVMKAAGLSFELEMGDWNAVKKKLEEGTIDAIAGMYYSIPRDRFFDFSNSHSVIDHSIFVWEENRQVRSLKDLRGHRVVVVRGDVMHTFLLEERIGVDLMLAKTVRDAIKLLSLHRAEAAVLARMPALYDIKTLSITNVKGVGKPFEPLDFCFAVKEGNQALLAKLNQSLAVVKASGEYDRLKRKWFEPLEPRRELRDYLPYLLAASVLLLAVIFVLWFWNWLLQREVRVKTKALQVANQELKQLDQFKTDVVNMVAHEVRAPLSVMHGYTDFLAEGRSGDLKPHQKEVLEKIQHSIEWMNRLVNDLLDMAQLETGKLELHPSQVEAAPLASAVAVFFEDRLRDKKIVLEKILDPPSLSFRADRDRVTQCLINLISNALKHTSQGGKITLAIKRDGDEVRFEVHDTGSGMDQKTLEKLFQKFQSGHKERGLGYGLGLSITKGLVELHKGRIWVESEEEKGSMFAFSLPQSLTDTGPGPVGTG